ncbi:hypothetical protein SAMN05444487_10591 [Marininema mesophilum]|uniref:Uncharacterized protein n=1 Tax=Marininema mesophilum TaxID=1048340 RepID=A0A1H2VGT2_9BACL|nr:hypothetical protein [Marininema mesophilum]SDW67069.1 hypothetical protein SAMN05444487_10591 [Marininema mesophilum]
MRRTQREREFMIHMTLFGFADPQDNQEVKEPSLENVERPHNIGRGALTPMESSLISSDG